MNNRFPTLSLFTGAMGLDLGLEMEGFEVRVANEMEAAFCRTIATNRPCAPIVQGDIRGVPTQHLLDLAGIRRGEVALVCGGPPCQAYSTAGKRLSIQDPRGSLFREFVRVVDEAAPRYFVMENVRGLLSAAIRHRPLNQRGPEHPPLTPEEQHGSVLAVILAEFARIGYTVNYSLLNAANYGVPQTRERVVFIGSRDGEVVPLPSPTHAEQSTNGLLPWLTLGDALEGLHDPEPQYRPYSEARARFFRMVPPGCGWRAIPKDLQPLALKGAYHSGGGKMGFYRRLSLDRPSPTVVTSPDQLATSMCHPTETRPLSVRECARIQQFPDDWQFAGKIAQQYAQIGNAVPIGLGQAIGRAVRAAIEGHVEAHSLVAPLAQLALAV